MKSYDVIIVGAGITGTALVYALARYSNITSIALIEKCDEPAQVNSKSTNNSQTLHFGDIETNYTLERAKEVRHDSNYVKKFLKRCCVNGIEYCTSYKMVLGIGPEEVSSLEKRFDEFKVLYPELRKMYGDELAQFEPKLMEGRSPQEKVLALVTPEGYAVDYELLANNFLREALKVSGKKIDVFFSTEVTDARHGEDGSVILETTRGAFRTRAVEFAAGGYSLYFARKFGLGRQYTLLSVAGNFYFTPKIIRGKVYRVQVEELPFAAPHGDPEVHHPDRTRFGPSAKPILLLERYHWKTFFDYFRASAWNFKALRAVITILSNPFIFRFILYNILYEIPYFGTLLFVRREMRQIIPSLQLRDVSFARGYGGTRPQIIDIEQRKIELGVGKLYSKNIIFNITPSPGASQCMGSALEDAQKLIEFLGQEFTFNKVDFEREWGGE